MEKLFEISGMNIYIQIFVTLISIIVHLVLNSKKELKETKIQIIAIYTICLSGWFGLISGVMGHMLYADQVAKSIDWPINSGFQMELGFAAIGIGLIGFIGFWKRSFILPYIISRSIFLLGAGTTHIIHIIKYENLSPSNTGIVLYWDFLFPIVLIVLYVLYAKDLKKQSIDNLEINL